MNTNTSGPRYFPQHPVCSQLSAPFLHSARVGEANWDKSLKHSQHERESSHSDAGGPGIRVKWHCMKHVAAELHARDLHAGAQEPDAHEKPIVKDPFEHVDFVENAAAVELVEELHPYERVVDDRVAVVAGVVLPLSIGQQRHADSASNVTVGAVT